MQWLEHRIPPPLVLLAALLLMRLIAEFASVRLLPVDNALWRIAAGILFVFLGVVCAVLGVRSFRRAQTTVNPLQPDKASQLVITGVFRYSRNPMYLGMLLVSLGWAFYLNSALAVIGVVGFILFITRFQIVPEERAMLALFGAEFERYQAQTRRWI